MQDAAYGGMFLTLYTHWTELLILPNKSHLTWYVCTYVLLVGGSKNNGILEMMRGSARWTLAAKNRWR